MALVDNYSKEELQEFVNQSNSYRDLLKLLGYISSNGNTYKIVKSRIEAFGINTSHFSEYNHIERCPENIFIKNSNASQAVLRRWYLKGNYTLYECAICKLPAIWQDKPLTLTLDHIDGDSRNDELSNLRWICPNCDRQLPTYSMGKRRLEQKQKRNIEKYYCVKCGINEVKNPNSQCRSCASKQENSLKYNISRDELKKDIRIMPMVQVGKKYNISDTAIRKWCEYHNLPKKKSEIKSYSDEEWELI